MKSLLTTHRARAGSPFASDPDSGKTDQIRWLLHSRVTRFSRALKNLVFEFVDDGTGTERGIVPVSAHRRMITCVSVQLRP